MCNDAYVDEEPGENELMDYAYEGPDNPDQEEANFYWTLNEFQNLVATHGIKKVIRELDDDTESAIYWYYRMNPTGEEVLF